MIRIIHRRRWGVLVNRHALWIGVHASPYNGRVCINLVPCITVWIIHPTGVRP